MKRWEWWSWGGIAAMAGLLVVAAIVAREPVKQPQPFARPYRNYDICALTPPGGIAVEPGRTVWQGLQTVSLRTDVRTSWVPMLGEQTTARAQELLHSMAAGQCKIIVTTGDAPSAGVAAVRDRYPQVKFVVLNGTESADDVTAQVLPLVPPKGQD